MRTSPPADVKAAFDAFPRPARNKLLALRKLILQTAAADKTVGPLTETLKWGEPAYLTEQSKSGSTIRIGWKASDPDVCAMYLNCQTSLVDTYRALFPELDYAGNRAVLFGIDAPLPQDEVRQCISLALTYHRDKRQQRRRA